MLVIFYFLLILGTKGFIIIYGYQDTVLNTMESHWEAQEPRLSPFGDQQQSVNDISSADMEPEVLVSSMGTAKEPPNIPDLESLAISLLTLKHYLEILSELVKTIRKLKTELKKFDESDLIERMLQLVQNMEKRTEEMQRTKDGDMIDTVNLLNTSEVDVLLGKLKNCSTTDMEKYKKVAQFAQRNKLSKETIEKMLKLIDMMTNVRARFVGSSDEELSRLEGVLKKVNT